MSSAFDSEVYAERQRLPGVTVSLPKLMRDLLLSFKEDAKHVTLELKYRPDVETSMWWTLRWGGEPPGRFADASTLELCLFRAAVLMRREDERAKKYAEAQELPFFLQPEFMAKRHCSSCGAVCTADPSWRWNGSEWEHKCENVHPQCGSFVAEVEQP